MKVIGTGQSHPVVVPCVKASLPREDFGKLVLGWGLDDPWMWSTSRDRFLSVVWYWRMALCCSGGTAATAAVLDTNRCAVSNKKRTTKPDPID